MSSESRLHCIGPGPCSSRRGAGLSDPVTLIGRPATIPGPNSTAGSSSDSQNVQLSESDLFSNSASDSGHNAELRPLLYWKGCLFNFIARES